MLNLNERTKTKPKPKPTLIFRNCTYVGAYRCAQLSYTTQNSSYNFPPYPPHNHHSSGGLLKGRWIWTSGTNKL